MWKGLLRKVKLTIGSCRAISRKEELTSFPVPRAFWCKIRLKVVIPDIFCRFRQETTNVPQRFEPSCGSVGRYRLFSRRFFETSFVSPVAARCFVGFQVHRRS